MVEVEVEEKLSRRARRQVSHRSPRKVLVERGKKKLGTGHPVWLSSIAIA